jgi:hypothetical protein
MASTYNISLVQGESLDLTLNLKDSDSVPLNLSGYSVRGTVKRGFGATGVLLDLAPVIVTGANNSFLASGQITISISPAESSSLPVTEAVYDIERYTLNDVVVQKVMNCKIIIDPEVST